MCRDAAWFRFVVQNARRSDPAGALRAPVPRRRADRGRADGARPGSRSRRCRSISASSKQAGLVRDRHEGRQTHYSAQLGALGPADRLDQPDGRLLAEPVRRPRRSRSRGWTNDRHRHRNPLRRRRARDRLSAGKDLARADPAAPDRGMADEERFQAGGGPPVQASAATGAACSTARCWKSSRTRRSPTRWNFATDPAFDLRSVVTFTLTPTGAGTHLRMEQAGFRPDQKQAYRRRAARLAAVLRQVWSRCWRGWTDGHHVARASARRRRHASGAGAKADRNRR